MSPRAHISAGWEPGVAPSLWVLVETGEQAGTLEDPIPVPDTVTTAGMEYEKGKYYSEAGTVYLMDRQGMENGEKAIEFAKQNLGVQKDRTTCYKAFELLGSAYYLILQYDSARYYLQKSLFTTDYATKAGAYMYLADIAKEQET